MNNIKYSVIIPAYQAEKTIKRCLHSVLNNKRTDIEAIVINDGSTDRTDVICQNFEDPRLHYEYQENAGVSAARNHALDLAQGTYVLFLDSDDFLAKNVFDKIDSQLDGSADLIILGRREVNGKAFTDQHVQSWIESEEKSISDVLAEKIRNQQLANPTGKVFRRSIINENNLRFQSGLHIGEDTVFVFSYIMYVHCIQSIDLIIYAFTVDNQDSLSRRRRDYLADHLRRGHIEMKHILDYADIGQYRRRALYSALAWKNYRCVYSVAKEYLKFDYSSRMRRKKLKNVCADFASTGLIPADFKTKIIAFPVQWRLTGLIDLITVVKGRL